MDTSSSLLSLLIFIAAILYSSVGHGGASGYIAVMALLGVSSQVMKPTALVLNIIVAGISSIRFGVKGHFNWRIFWPFAITSIPCAYIGGTLSLPSYLYKPLVGIILIFAAYRIIIMKESEVKEYKEIKLSTSFLAGAGIGIISGLTGVGGGIFLSPLLILMNWASLRDTAGVSAVFILLNSISGLLGNYKSTNYLPENLIYFIGAAVIGAFIGSNLGLVGKQYTIRRLLAVVLVIAGLKMIFTF